MSVYYKQMQHGSDEAKSKLQERLSRQEMGDAAYEKEISKSDDRAFRMFGIAFIFVFAVVILSVVLSGY